MTTQTTAICFDMKKRLLKHKNSWVLSVENIGTTRYNHYYFCVCSRKFKLQTQINEPYAPDIICPMCGNDYFKDANEFDKRSGAHIWKSFELETVEVEDEECWKIILKYEFPVYYENIDEVKLQNKDLLHVVLRKDGTSSADVLFKSKVISLYSLLIDGKLVRFKKLFHYRAKKSLYKFLMMNNSKNIGWIDKEEIEHLSIDEKLKFVSFFLKNSHLKEYRFFFWKMDLLIDKTLRYTTEIEMLNYIANHRKEKSAKKALYKGYEDSINYIGYYPYSDYVFSRTIDNIDLLAKLYVIYPTVKKEIFTDENFEVAIEFMMFLKRHYSEKQITKLFIEEMQNVRGHSTNLENFRDILLLLVLQEQNAFKDLEQHFIKVKLTTKKLHDEIVRVSHLVSYVEEKKEVFEYDKKYLSACGMYEELEFKLPSTVKELSLWAKMLHNCMFGYSKKIHNNESIIYGVFKASELLYAVEIRGAKIVQAKAVSNNIVPAEDMTIINDWKKNSMTIIQT